MVATVITRVRIIVPAPPSKPAGGSLRFDPTIAGLGVVLLLSLVGWLL